jgi:Flp pilus assembly protein protease CpaA
VKAFLFTAIAGGLLAVIVSLHRRRLSATLAATARMIAMPADVRHEIKTAVPASRFAYGPAIAIGSMLAVLLA